MSKYENDSKALSAQNAAYEAAELERLVMERYIDGKATDEQVIAAMKFTEAAVSMAVSIGCSLKDLPAV